MLRRMPVSVFMDWLAFAASQPFGDERADLRMGISTAAIVNSWLDRKKRPYKPSDFMPFTKKRPQVGTVEETARRLMALNASLGGTFVDKRPPERRGKIVG